MLKIKNLTKTFNDSKILDDVSLEIKDKSITVLLGQSGVGKSTILRILNNLETPDDGNFYLDDKEINLTKANKEHLFGIVFQQFNLFEHLTIQENIVLPLTKVANIDKNAAKQIAHALLAKYDLQTKENNYPNELSGGQKQRVAIARTLALKPKVICLDEPTSALDPLLTNFVAEIIRELAKEYMVLLATHDVGLLEKLNCTIHLMKSGKIVESADSADFMVNKNKYPQLNNFVQGKN